MSSCPWQIYVKTASWERLNFWAWNILLQYLISFNTSILCFLSCMVFQIKHFQFKCVPCDFVYGFWKTQNRSTGSSTVLALCCFLCSSDFCNTWGMLLVSCTFFGFIQLNLFQKQVWITVNGSITKLFSYIKCAQTSSLIIIFFFLVPDNNLLMPYLNFFVPPELMFPW